MNLTNNSLFSSGTGNYTNFFNGKEVNTFSFESISEEKVVYVFFVWNDRPEKLLTRAVNNRTRERNYFRLYSQLLEGELTEDEFNREIDENEDEYVVSNNEEATFDDLWEARRLSDGLKDVEYAEDMNDLFSFSHSSVRKCLKEAEKWQSSLVSLK